jgi:hypothetical protein
LRRVKVQLILVRFRSVGRFPAAAQAFTSIRAYLDLRLVFHGLTSDDPSSQQLAIEKLLQPALTRIVCSSCEITHGASPF